MHTIIRNRSALSGFCDPKGSAHSCGGFLHSQARLSFRKAAVYGDDIQGLRVRIEQRDFETGEGTIREEDILPSYLDSLADKIHLDRPLKVVMLMQKCLWASSISPRKAQSMT